MSVWSLAKATMDQLVNSLGARRSPRARPWEELALGGARGALDRLVCVYAHDGLTNNWSRAAALGTCVWVRAAGETGVQEQLLGRAG